MATSGSYSGNNVGSGQYFYGEWQLASQSVANNTSTINWQSYAHFTNSDAQLDNGYTNSSVGMLWQNTGRVYNYTGNFTTRFQGLASGSFTITHNNDGTKSFFLSGAITYYNGNRSENFGTTWDLPTIPRYANFSSVSITNLTDVTFTVNFTLDATCDRYAISLDGGTTYGNWVNTSFTSQSVNVASYIGYQLKSDTAYSYKIKVRRTDSQLETTSLTYTNTTLGQSNFGGFFD